MSNRNIVLDKNGRVVGEYHASLGCFFIVNQIIEKYNPGKNLMFDVENADKILEPVYEKCKGYEEVQLLMFINSESNFDESDVVKFDEAIERYHMENEGPKGHLVFMRDMLKKHGNLTTKYMDTTMAMTVTSA